MKRILLGIALLFSVIASGQVVIGGGKVIGGGGGGLTTEEKADLGYAVDGQYFLSKASNNITTAITNINNLYSTEGKRYALIIDHDLDLSGVSASTITIPSSIPVIIKPGNKIITPTVVRDIVGGTNPIVGTVAANYVQIQINGPFTAPKNQQIFEGDGLIWFGNQSVDEITPMWWGMSTSGSDSTTQANNVRAFQMAINSVVLDKSNRATSKVKLPNGDIYMNSPVVAFACALDSHPFLTGKRNDGTVSSTILNIEGAERIKHEVNYGQTSNIFYTAKWGAPLMLQGLRNSSIENIRWEGNNYFEYRDSEWYPSGLGGGDQTYLKTVLRPDKFYSYDTSLIAWIQESVKWGIYQPYAAIITDPFRTDVSNINAGFSLGNTPESTIDMYYATTNLGHQNSWDVQLQHMHFEHFVEGIVNTLTGQQGDTYLYKDLMFQSIPIGISTVQDQSRDCKAYEIMSYGGVWALFENTLHGNGILPEVQSMHAAGGLKYIHFGTRNNGILKFDSVYAELVYSFGASGSSGYYNGNGVGDEAGPNTVSFPATISNSTIKTVNPQYTISGETYYLNRPPTIKGFNIINSVIGPYADDDTPKRAFQAYEYCNFMGVVTGNGSDYRFPIDYGWALSYKKNTLIRNNEREASLTNGSNNVLTTRLSGRKSGRFFKQDNSNMAFESVQYSLDATIDYLQYFVTGTRTPILFSDKGTIKIPWGGTSPVNVNDLIAISKHPYYALGVVVETDETSFTIANFTSREISDFASVADGSNNINGALLYKLNFQNSFHPFLASKGASNSEFTIENYASFNNDTSSGGSISSGTYLRTPDGKEYRITKVEGSTIYISGSYTPSLNHEWIEPVLPNFKTTKFFNTSVNGGNFLQSSYYFKGEKYEYYKGPGEKVDGYVICTKNGDFSDAKSGSTRAQYKANFLRYNSNGYIIDYIDGENTLYPMIAPLHIPFNKTGTTANRPDSLGIPSNVIPYGYPYTNTDTGTKQFWNGTAFVEMGDGTGTDDQTASEVAFTPAGTISATNVQSAIEEVGTESVRTTIAGFTGTPLTAILQQTKAQMDSDGPAPSGTMVVCEDCPLEETITGSTVVLKDTPIYIDNRTADATSFSFSNLAVGREATIDLQQTGVPTYTASGVTFTRMSLQDFEDETRLQVKFKVQSLTEILYSYYKAY